MKLDLIFDPSSLTIGMHTIKVIVDNNFYNNPPASFVSFFVSFNNLIFQYLLTIRSLFTLLNTLNGLHCLLR